MKSEAVRTFVASFGEVPVHEVVAPGRVNLIGEHIDYAGLPVLPMAIDRGVRLLVRPRAERTVRLVNENAAYGRREFRIESAIPRFPAGDWGNYPKAAIQGLVAAGLGPGGFDALVRSDLPPAAGLSSSSALLVATALAGLAAGMARVDRLELAEMMAAAERYVGARGGGMDQAAILAGRKGHALRIAFSPLSVREVPVPGSWGFVVAHSLASAEKSGAARETYNARRAEVEAAAAAVGEGSYADLVAGRPADELLAHARPALPGPEYRRFRHVITEADRVARAEAALAAADIDTFGAIMLASHASLRDDFDVSTPALNELVDVAVTAGAIGARLTGAGLGGCVVALLPAPDVSAFLTHVAERFYRPRGVHDPSNRLFPVRPSDGAAARPL